MDHELLERVAAQHGIFVDDVYETLFGQVDIESVEAAAKAVSRDRLVALVRKLFRLRLANERGFDAFALKVLFPDLTHAEIARLMAWTGRAKWSSRRRSQEALRDLMEKHPEIEAVVAFDTRGGDQTRKGKAPSGE